MRRSNVLLFVVCLIVPALAARAQVLMPEEVKDPAARGLQRKYMPELKSLAADLRTHPFAYPFYFSRVLDLDEKQQRRADQRSIRFDKYREQTVLEMTGNYYAAYSAELMDRNARAQQTLNDVMLPLLKAAVPRFAGADTFEAYALEVSHHVRRRVLGVQTENAENVVLIAPRAVAEQLVRAQTPDQQQSALEEVEMYLDAQPVALRVKGAKPVEMAEARPAAVKAAPPAGQAGASARPEAVPQTMSVAAFPAATPAASPAPSAVQPVTKETLAATQARHQETLARMVQDLDAQAHFVSYAPPAFIEFRGQSYLELSLTTPVKETGSRYKLAALAFDDHIAHLVRPVVACFKDDPGFSGIAFSTSVHVADSPSSVAVEFFLPLAALRSFAQYDITGQQLIDSGMVLINGERAGVNLQLSESTR